MVLQQPVDAVVVAALFVGRERDDDVAVGTKPSCLQRIRLATKIAAIALSSARAAAVEVAVLLDERERDRSTSPRAAPRRRRGGRGAGSASACRRRGTARRDCPCVGGREDLHVLGREAGGAQARGHRLGRLRVVADRVGRVDLDQLLEDVPGELGVVRLGVLEEREEKNGARNIYGCGPFSARNFLNSSSDPIVMNPRMR